MLLKCRKKMQLSKKKDPTLTSNYSITKKTLLNLLVFRLIKMKGKKRPKKLRKKWTKRTKS